MNLNEYLYNQTKGQVRNHTIKIFKKESKTYVKDPSEAPDGKSVKTGPQGGHYYDDDGSTSQKPTSNDTSQKPSKEPDLKSSGGRDKFVRTKVHTPEEIQAKYHDQKKVDDIVKKSLMRPEHRNEIDSAKVKFKSGQDTQGIYKKDGEYTPERKELHNEIIKKFVSDKPSQEHPNIILLGGIAGSGKSTVVDNYITKKDSYVVVDSDAVKTMLPEFKKYGAGGAMMTHKESSDITQQILKQALANNQSVIYDGTMRSLDKYHTIIDGVKDKGYSTTLYGTALPTHKSIERAMVRYNGGGRYVPPELINEMGKTINRNIHTMKHKVDNYKIFDTDVPFNTPINRIEKMQSEERKPDNEIVDIYNQLYDDEEDKMVDAVLE